ncbi:MAG: O-antigen ligase family protein [Coleofasciculus sp. B1-GNL1-01]|uniref:O-antigen ligase family protein n=1 Tax=Coleofasciculus sp. B1-GNL1-01 TaxID=3068484 RepID=UPI00330288DA
MTPQAQLAMLALIPLVLYIFTRFPPPKAVVISFIVAWLFLPQKTAFSFPGLPDYTRVSATVYCVLLATFIFDVGRFSSFKLSWLDLPMLIWCLCPLASSISNNLGVYDGMSSVLSQTLLWGVPYFLGRIYFNNWRGLRLLVIGIFIGGLVYVPFCLYEIRMSPQLHRMVYGFFPHMFLQTMRYGGFRPQVFMQHGLEVGMWMMAATLAGIWLWQARGLKQVWGIPMGLLMPVLLITFILIKSTGAWLLLGIGIVILFTIRWFQTSLPLLLVIGAMFFYLGMGVSGTFTGERADQMVSFMAQVTNEERAASLQIRFDNEEELGDKARQRIIFGWGGWGRNRIYEYNRYGEEINTSLTDSLWMQAFGIRGIVGLLSVYVAMLLPVVRFCLGRYPPQTWFNPKVAPAAIAALILTLYMFDCLLNAIENPIYMLLCGGLAGFLLNQPETQKLRGSRPSVSKAYLVR